MARTYFFRVNADGTLDTAFNPGPNGTVNSIAVQADGKILVGGNFTTLGGATVAITDAELIGVSGLELYASGTVKVNRATDADGVTELDPRMNWTLATNATNN